MSDLTPITREETFLNGDTELTPITREEKILAGEDIETKTRREWFLKKYRNSGGDISVEPITITENGTITAPQGTAYSPITVDVPQPQPTLITKSITDNGTYNASDDNADGYSSVTVNVPPIYVKEVPNLPASIASFSDGAVGNLADLKISIEPVQDLSHGDPSPTNICPISGWDKVNLNVSGVNAWDEEWEVGGLNPLNGDTTSENDRIRSKNFSSCKPNMTMFYYIPSGKGNLQIVFYDINKNYLGYYNFTTEHTFTTPNGCYFFKFNTGGSYGTTYNNDISINYPSTDTNYHAYNGHTYTIDLDGTRYGGTLDVVSGVLTLTHGYIASYNGETLPSTWISDRDVYAEGTTPTIGAEVCYELATPTTIQLTPTQVTSLLADNNIYADCGEVVRCVYPCTI